LGSVLGAGSLFGLIHGGAFLIACTAALTVLGMAEVLGVGPTLFLEVLIIAAYCAVADLLYIGRLTAYLAIIRRGDSFDLPEPQSIVVLDFGAQYSQLIARRVREQNVFSVVLPCNAKIEEIRKYSPAGIILSGGPSSVYDKDAPVANSRVFGLGVPVLGICYG